MHLGAAWDLYDRTSLLVINLVIVNAANGKYIPNRDIEPMVNDKHVLLVITFYTQFYRWLKTNGSDSSCGPNEPSVTNSGPFPAMRQ